MDYANVGIIFWIAIIVVAAITAGCIAGVVDARNKTRRHIAEVEAGGSARELSAQVVASNQAVAERLDSIEKRLGAIEKTLTDIP